MKKKRILFGIIAFLLLLFIVLGCWWGFKLYEETNLKAKQEKKMSVLQANYNKYVVTTEEIFLYKKDEDKFEVIGKINSGVELTLGDIELDTEVDYFPLETFEDEYYVGYENLVPIEKLSEVDYRYKKYIVFNKNIVTNDSFDFFDENGTKVYSLNFSLNLPIVINDEDNYGVEYNNRLLFVKKEDVKEVVFSNNTSAINIDGIRVLNYHFFYKDGNQDGCYEEICASESQFREHLEYLKQENILTLKMEEVEMYIDGKINLPKSVLITIDDGWRTNVAVDMLKEYEMYGTIFLVTAWFDIDNYYKNEFVELHSHGDNLHNQGVCSEGQGGAIKCLEEEKLLADLRTARDKLNGSKAFAYPFYEYNDYSIEMLKKAGYSMAFVGESSISDNLIHVGSNKFKLPRFVVVDYTTMHNFKRYFGDTN